MNRVRILPLLKRLGFKQDKETPSKYVHVDGIHEARIHKLDDDVRAIDITQSVYVTHNGEGEFHHRESLLKSFPLDFEDSEYGFYEVWLVEMGRTFRNKHVFTNREYYFSRSEERATDDTYYAD